MNLTTKLSRRIGKNDILQILQSIEGSNQGKEELYCLAQHENDNISFQALWTLCHLSTEENRWLFDKHNQLIDQLLACTHGGKRRLLLSILYRQPMSNPPRVDFLNYCLDTTMEQKELPGVHVLCFKTSYELCLLIPELLQEFNSVLHILENPNMPPYLRSAYRHILKALSKKKSLQKY